MTLRPIILALALGLVPHAHASSPINVEAAGHVRNPGPPRPASAQPHSLQRRMKKPICWAPPFFGNVH